MDRVSYNVSGLINQQSKTSVINALDKVEGVQEVAVDMAKGMIEVEYNPPATLDRIECCIEKTGFRIQ